MKQRPFLAVIDTNVIVAALLSKATYAATVQIIGKIASGDIIPLYSTSILEEYREVLARPKFGFDSKLTQSMVDTILNNGMLIDPNALSVELIDKDDLPFYEIVMDTRDDGSFLVTGNLKHFPREPYIVTPREMLGIIDGSRPEETFDNPASPIPDSQTPDSTLGPEAE